MENEKIRQEIKEYNNTTDETKRKEFLETRVDKLYVKVEEIKIFIIFC